MKPIEEIKKTKKEKNKILYRIKVLIKKCIFKDNHYYKCNEYTSSIKTTSLDSI